MLQTSSTITVKKWLAVLFSAVLLLTFFLPWVSWDGSRVSGYGMPSGDFFSISEARFGLPNPFPKLSFTFLVFWLIPALSLVTIIAVFVKKKTVPFAFFAGALGLGLLTFFILFTAFQIDTASGKNLIRMLRPAAFIHALSAIGLIFFAFPVKTIAPKIIWLLIGPVIAWGSYVAGEKYIMGQTHESTEQVKADYTLNADELIREFIANDTAANKKYLEKVLLVSGKAASAELQADSTSTIRFADSTGSYAIFSLEKNQFDLVKNIHTGDTVSVKAVCSGSIFSDILGTTSISFKRATLNNK
ncbi:MAG TPA: hypothetical protein VGO58_11450 [Chitinophagaceae bacterium]|nr:hypothetical protein [Chitinophagaceae bacterium]